MTPGWHRARVRLRTALLVLGVGFCTSARLVHAAKPAPQAQVICAQCVTDADAAIENEVRIALGKLATFDLLPPSSRDFEAVQLSSACSDESADCLRKVARMLRTSALFVSRITRQKGASVLRILYFDALSGRAPREVTRERTGKAALGWQSELPAMLRELLREHSEPAAVPPPGPAPASERVADSPDDLAPAGTVAPKATSASVAGPKALPLGPLLLGGAGVASVAGGLVVGAAMQDTEDGYRARPIDSQVQADLAENDRKRGERQALVANVLLGTGIAAVVAAGVWLVLELREPERPAQTKLAPVVGPKTAGVVLLGTWEQAP